MATYTTQPITVDIQPTTKFSDYKNKIQDSLQQFGDHVNEELVAMFGVISTDANTTYTIADIDNKIVAIDTKHNNKVW